MFKIQRSHWDFLIYMKNLSVNSVLLQVGVGNRAVMVRVFNSDFQNTRIMGKQRKHGRNSIGPVHRGTGRGCGGRCGGAVFIGGMVPHWRRGETRHRPSLCVVHHLCPERLSPSQGAGSCRMEWRHDRARQGVGRDTDRQISERGVHPLTLPISRLVTSAARSAPAAQFPESRWRDKASVRWGCFPSSQSQRRQGFPFGNNRAHAQ